jgi:hypothetical protein
MASLPIGASTVARSVVKAANHAGEDAAGADVSGAADALRVS